jgi:MFS family permease
VHTSTFGWLMAINGIMIVLLQPTAIGIVTKLHRGRVLAVAALLQGIGFGMYAPGSSLPWYIAAVVVWTFAELGYSPVAPAVVSDLAPARLRGTYQGVYSMAWGASSCVAPAIGSVVLGHLGSTALWTGCFGVCLVAVWLHLTRGSAYTRHVSVKTRAE